MLQFEEVESIDPSNAGGAEDGAERKIQINKTSFNKIWKEEAEKTKRDADRVTHVGKYSKEYVRPVKDVVENKINKSMEDLSIDNPGKWPGPKKRSREMKMTGGGKGRKTTSLPAGSGRLGKKRTTGKSNLSKPGQRKSTPDPVDQVKGSKRCIDLPNGSPEVGEEPEQEMVKHITCRYCDVKFNNL